MMATTAAFIPNPSCACVHVEGLQNCELRRKICLCQFPGQGIQPDVDDSHPNQYHFKSQHEIPPRARGGEICTIQDLEGWLAQNFRVLVCSAARGTYTCVSTKVQGGGNPSGSRTAPCHHGSHPSSWHALSSMQTTTRNQISLQQ